MNHAEQDPQPSFHEVTFFVQLDNIQALHAHLVRRFRSAGNSGVSPEEIEEMIGPSSAPKLLECIRLALDNHAVIPGLSIMDSVVDSTPAVAPAEPQPARPADRPR